MAQQGQGQQDNSNDWAFYLLGIVAFVLIIWWRKGTEIKSLAFMMWGAQAWIIGLFNSDIDKYAQWMANADPARVDLDKFFLLSSVFAEYTKWVPMMVLTPLAYYVFTQSTKERFKRKMDMDGLTNSERMMWPQVYPFIRLKLIEQDPNKGPWASAPTPRQYAKNTGMLGADGVYDVEKAASVFEAQLGPLFTNIMAMPIHTRALFAIFALRVNGDDDSSKAYAKCLARATTEKGVDFQVADNFMKQYVVDGLMGKIAGAKKKGKAALLNLNFPEAIKHYKKVAEIKLDIAKANSVKSMMNKLIAENAKNRKISKLAQMHAYESTFMTSMLQIARGSGICNDTDFLCWLKPIDRTLWYALSQTGRRVAWVEAAGIRSHWLSEITAGIKIEDPRLQQAIEAMADELADTMDAPEDPMKFRY